MKDKLILSLLILIFSNQPSFSHESDRKNTFQTERNECLDYVFKTKYREYYPWYTVDIPMDTIFKKFKSMQSKNPQFPTIKDEDVTVVNALVYELEHGGEFHGDLEPIWALYTKYFPNDSNAERKRRVALKHIKKEK